MQANCRAPSVIGGHLQRAIPSTSLGHLLHGRMNCFLEIPLSPLTVKGLWKTSIDQTSHFQTTEIGGDKWTQWVCSFTALFPTKWQAAGCITQHHLCCKNKQAGKGGKSSLDGAVRKTAAPVVSPVTTCQGHRRWSATPQVTQRSSLPQGDFGRKAGRSLPLVCSTRSRRFW